jgi:hypothetical protein
MSEENLETNELELLKQRAEKLGIKFHPNIGLEALRERVNERLAASTEASKEEAASAEKGEETEAQRRQRLKKEASRLVRIRVSCMNPNKKAWEGEVFTVSNSVVGTFKKYVPFNADEGWHVPEIIYKQIRDRKCQVFQWVKGPRGEKIRKGKLINEFNVEVLPPLTKEELEELARQQALARAID